MPKETFDLHGLFQHMLLEIHATWRYRWRALLVAWCVVIVGAVLVFSLPNKYESSAEIYADTDALTNPLLKGIAVQPDVRQRLLVITRTLLSRPNLETVADQTGLSLRATSPADKDALLDQLGKDVRLQTTNNTNLYTIIYDDADPRMAQKVIQAFLQILMNDTLGANATSTESAQNFLQQQVTDYSNRLNDAEKKLADFKKENMAYLPAQGGADYSTRLQIAEGRLQDLQALAAVAGGSGGASGQRVNTSLEAIDQQIATYKQQLDKLLLTYTEQYPDVITARRMIKELQARREDVLKHPGSAQYAVVTPKGSPRPASGNGSALSAQIAAQQAQIADLKANADKIAQAQLELQQLSRNYDINKKQYDELVSRLNQAQLSQDATQTGNSLKFRVISPPIVPLTPVSPNRALLLLVVLALALGIGAAFAYFLHKIKPAFMSLKSLREFADYPVIGSFSLIESKDRRHGQRRELLRFITGTGLLAAVVVLGIAFSGPLATLMQHVFTVGAT